MGSKSGEAVVAASEPWRCSRELSKPPALCEAAGACSDLQQPPERCLCRLGCLKLCPCRSGCTAAPGGSADAAPGDCHSCEIIAISDVAFSGF